MAYEQRAVSLQGAATCRLLLLRGYISQNSQAVAGLVRSDLVCDESETYGVSAKGLAPVLGVDRYMTVWTWLHKLRVAMVRPGRDRLSGTVEVDETYIGGPRPGKRGRGAEGKCLVLVAVEDKGKALGRIRLRQIVDASANSLVPAVTDAVEPGSVVRTDEWKGYNRLRSKGYGRQIARKRADVGENLLPLANRVISLLKR